MYKTIRHGENSLQYTILPQNDDFRIEGKLTSATSNNSNGRPKSKRSVRRRSFFAYLGLLFVCAIIIGAILVPLLVSAECLRNPSDWFLKTRTAFTGTESPTSFQVRNTTFTSLTLTTIDEMYSNKPIDIGVEPYLLKSTVIPQTISIDKAQNGPTLVLTNISNSNTRRTDISESQIKNSSRIVQVRIDDSQSQLEEHGVPIIVNNFVRKTDQNYSAVIGDTFLFKITASIGSTMRPTSAPIASKIKGRVIQVPLLKSAAKKIIIPPVLAKNKYYERKDINIIPRDKETILKTQDVVDQSKPTSSIWSHWSYLNPSTYFTWTGYKTEESAILPSIILAVLIVIIMIIVIFFIVRNMRTYVNLIRNRTGNDIESAGEDNTTLLINNNLSDDD